MASFLYALSPSLFSVFSFFILSHFFSSTLLEPAQVATKKRAGEMKIFNWVHKTFHHSVQKDVIGQNVKKIESVLNEAEKEALLKQVELEDALHGWNGGILTIGTFGFETLKLSKQQKEYLVLDSEEEEDEEGDKYFVNGDEIDSTEYYSVEDEELNPLMITSFGSEIEVAGENCDANEEKTDVILTVDGVPLTPFLGLGAYEMSFEDCTTMEADESKKKGERITLADLFLADADIKMKMKMKMNMKTKKVNPRSNEKQIARTKNGLSFAKKFIPRVKEDSHPIKNIQRMVKKMLKKKIHPEIDYGLNGETETVANTDYEILEPVSLLPTQDATV